MYVFLDFFDNWFSICTFFILFLADLQFVIMIFYYIFTVYTGCDQFCSLKNNIYFSSEYNMTLKWNNCYSFCITPAAPVELPFLIYLYIFLRNIHILQCNPETVYLNLFWHNILSVMKKFCFVFCLSHCPRSIANILHIFKCQSIFRFHLFFSDDY